MTPGGKRVVLVAAVAANGVIGDGPDIPWKIPGEQARFKDLTMGHVLLMGRTTFESIGRALPGRSTIVLTRSDTWVHEGVVVAASVPEALAIADSLPGDVMVAGGAEVYASALPYADEQVVSEVPLTPPGDAFYPHIDETVWAATSREECEGYTVVHWARLERRGAFDAPGGTPGFGRIVEHAEAEEQNRLGRTLITRLADPTVIVPLDDPVVKAVADDVRRLAEPLLFTQMLTALSLSAAKHAHLRASTHGAAVPTMAELRADQLTATALSPDVVNACFDALEAMAAMPEARAELVQTQHQLHSFELVAWLAMADVYLAYARMALPWSDHLDLDALLGAWFLLEQRALDEL